MSPYTHLVVSVLGSFMCVVCLWESLLLQTQWFSHNSTELEDKFQPRKGITAIDMSITMLASIHNRTGCPSTLNYKLIFIA